MWLRNGGLVAALVAVAAAGAVTAGTWFILTHDTTWAMYMDALGRTWAGVVTAAIAIIAGALLAVAFDRAEEAVARARQGSSGTQDGGPA